MPGWLKTLLKPKVLIPVVVMVGAVALLFSFGDPKKILGIMMSFDRTALIWVFLLSVLYEVVRFGQWLVLLKDEGVKVPLKGQIFSFSGGEATRFFPIGNYFQNYLLTVAEGADFAYTSAATTLIIVFEVAVCLVGLVILGLGSWWWVRPLVAGGTLAVVVIGWLIYRYHGTLDAPEWARRHARLLKTWEHAAEQLRQFGKGTQRILHWRTLAISFGLAALYLIVAGGILYVVLDGLGWHKTSFGDVLAVYFFSLAIALIFPLPADVGVTELSGVGAFLVVGVDRDTAISAMLINRVLSIGFSIVIAGIVSAVLRDELAKALQGRGATKTGQVGHEQGEEQGEHHAEEQQAGGWSHGDQSSELEAGTAANGPTPRREITIGSPSPSRAKPPGHGGHDSECAESHRDVEMS